jgi:hypothetical protein
MKPAIDSRSVLLESDRASFFVTTPNLAQRRKLRAFQRRRGARGAEDYANVVVAGAIDGIPKRADFIRRHPILRVQQHHGIDLETIEKEPKFSAL